jgi:hypothetical protein
VRNRVRLTKLVVTFGLWTSVAGSAVASNIPIGAALVRNEGVGTGLYSDLFFNPGLRSEVVRWDQVAKAMPFGDQSGVFALAGAGQHLDPNSMYDWSNLSDAVIEIPFRIDRNPGASNSGSAAPVEIKFNGGTSVSPSHEGRATWNLMVGLPPLLRDEVRFDMERDGNIVLIRGGGTSIFDGVGGQVYGAYFYASGSEISVKLYRDNSGHICAPNILDFTCTWRGEYWSSEYSSLGGDLTGNLLVSDSSSKINNTFETDSLPLSEDLVLYLRVQAQGSALAWVDPIISLPSDRPDLKLTFFNCGLSGGLPMLTPAELESFTSMGFNVSPLAQPVSTTPEPATLPTMSGAALVLASLWWRRRAAPPPSRPNPNSASVS